MLATLVIVQWHRPIAIKLQVLAFARAARERQPHIDGGCAVASVVMCGGAQLSVYQRGQSLHRAVA